MTVQELLKERYKIESPYPGSPFNVGEILYHDKDNNVWRSEQSGKMLHQNFPSLWDCPKIFRKLFWYEEREAREMPEYVSYVSMTLKDKYGDDETKTRRYVKTESWHKDEHGEWYYNDCYLSTLMHSYKPATEADYNQYLNNLK